MVLRRAVDHVRHDRGPEYPRSQKHALGACKPGREQAGQHAIRLRLGDKHLQGESHHDHPHQGGDRRLQWPEAPALELQDGEDPPPL